MTKKAIAIAAHPDDIEFMMAGTLILLKNVGYETHYMTLSDGNCGSLHHDSETTSRIRIEESKRAAKILGAKYHHPICHDFEIFYNDDLLRKLTAVIRQVEPDIILTHSPTDYMEDHMNTCRLTVTAAFVRGIPNYHTRDVEAIFKDCTIYHALPHGLRDPMRRYVEPGIFIDVSSVYEQKLTALGAHKSQQEWLDSSQNMNSYLSFLEDIMRKIGELSGIFEYAEGWNRHLHYGFCEEDSDPLRNLEKYYLLNERFENSLIV